MINNLRTCVDCNYQQPTSEFPSKGGYLQRRCRSCRKARKDRRIEHNKSRTIDTTKACAKCGVEKHSSEFGRVNAKKDGLDSYCLECNRDKKRKQRNKNKEINKNRKSYSDKKCASCGTVKPPSEFNKSHASRDGLYNKCRECHKDYMIKASYGISLDEYGEIFESQDGRCAICKEQENGKMLAVDHNHDTGEVRGLLCQKCNRAIGLLGDSVKLLAEAIKYLSAGKPELRS